MSSTPYSLTQNLHSIDFALVLEDNATISNVVSYLCPALGVAIQHVNMPPSSGSSRTWRRRGPRQARRWTISEP